MKKEEKNSFMGEWTPNEWGNFEESYLNDLKSSSDTSIDVAVKFSRKVFLYIILFIAELLNEKKT